MKQESRTSNSVKNMVVNLLLFAVSYIATFAGRTIFVRQLGNEYLSVSGLFSNVITLLSFAELGIGSASVYALYKPIADGDFRLVTKLLKYLGKLYKIIALATSCIGVCLIPFLHLFIRFEEVSFSYEYLIFVYILYVMNSCVSYLFIENQLFLIAYQKTYLVNAIHKSCQIVLLIVQSAILFAAHNFILYLAVQIVFGAVSNYIVRSYANRKEPRLKTERNHEQLSKAQKRELTGNIGSIFSYKVGAVVLNGTDNLIVSSFLSTLFVGILSNYTLVINAVNSVIMQCLNGIGASIGNHIVTSNKKDQVAVFRQLDLICYLLYGFCSICLYVLLNPFITLWLGDGYLIDKRTVLWLCLAFYVTGVNQIPSLYRTSFGLFHEARFYPIAAAVSNIFLSILFTKCMGLAGVFIATVLVRFTFFTLVDSRLIFKKGFEQSCKQYYIRYFFRIIILLVLCRAIDRAVALIGFGGFIADVLVCGSLSLAGLFAAIFWTEDFKLLYARFGCIIKGR